VYSPAFLSAHPTFFSRFFPLTYQEGPRNRRFLATTTPLSSTATRLRFVSFKPAGLNATIELPILPAHLYQQKASPFAGSFPLLRTPLTMGFFNIVSSIP